MRTDGRSVSMLVVAGLVVWLGSPASASAQRMDLDRRIKAEAPRPGRVEHPGRQQARPDTGHRQNRPRQHGGVRPDTFKHHRHSDGNVHHHRRQDGSAARTLWRARPFEGASRQPRPSVCINCGVPPEVLRPGVGPAPSDPTDRNPGAHRPQLRPDVVRAAERTGRRAVLRGPARDMSIPLTADKLGKKEAKQEIRAAAHKSLHKAVNSRFTGPYRALGHQAGHRAIPRLISIKMDEFKRARRAQEVVGP